MSEYERRGLVIQQNGQAIFILHYLTTAEQKRQADRVIAILNLAVAAADRKAHPAPAPVFP